MPIQQLFLGAGSAAEKGWIFKNTLGASDTTNMVGGQWESACSVAIDSNENVYYAAVAQILLSGTTNFSKRITYITKLDKEGTFQWCKLVRHQMPQFTASGNHTPVHGPSIDCDSSGNIYILYTRRGHSISYDTNYLEKRNSSGVRQWGKQIRIKSNNQNSLGVEVFVDSNDNLFAMCYQNNNNNSQGTLGRKVWITKVNPSTGAEITSRYCGRTYTGGTASHYRNFYGLQSCGLAQDGNNLIVSYMSTDNGNNGSGGSSPGATKASNQIQHFSHSGSFSNLRSRYADFQLHASNSDSADSGMVTVNGNGEIANLSLWYANISGSNDPGWGSYMVLDTWNGNDHGTQYAFRKNLYFGLNKTNANPSAWYGISPRGLKFDPDDNNILYMCGWGVNDSSGRYGFYLIKLTRGSVSSDWSVNKIMSVRTTFGSQELYWPSDDYSNRNAMEIKGDFLYLSSRVPTSGTTLPRRVGMVFKINKKLTDSGTYGDFIIAQENTNVLDVNPGNKQTNKGGDSTMPADTGNPTFNNWDNLQNGNNGVDYTGATKTVQATG
tara:strand:+ start:741 stop:2393 length:1653 start_codon:yes stop_codon:yes gene_type:complete